MRPEHNLYPCSGSGPEVRKIPQQFLFSNQYFLLKHENHPNYYRDTFDNAVAYVPVGLQDFSMQPTSLG